MIRGPIVAIDTTMRNFAAVFLIFASIPNLGCNVVQERREVHTLANLQALAARLQEMAEVDAAVEREDFDSVANEYFDHGEDPWGNLILFVPGSESGHSTFLLISTGSDGVLDIADAGEYFEIIQPRNSLDQEGRDIVMKGSTALSYGAHK